mgnify:CR=1 FL=1
MFIFFVDDENFLYLPSSSVITMRSISRITNSYSIWVHRTVINTAIFRSLSVDSPVNSNRSITKEYRVRNSESARNIASPRGIFWTWRLWGSSVLGVTRWATTTLEPFRGTNSSHRVTHFCRLTFDYFSLCEKLQFRASSKLKLLFTLPSERTREGWLRSKSLA